MDFTAARGDYVFDPNHYLKLLSLPELWTRAAPLITCLLVVTPFLLRDWRAMVVFPLSAVLIAATAAEPNIYLLRHHYPAAIIVLVTLGILETVIRSSQEVGGRLHTGYALFLIAATLMWHRMAGFLPYGGRYDRIYGIVYPAGEELLRVATEIPNDGVLLCPSELAGFCANRADLLTWESFDETRHRPDLVFVKLKDAGRFRQRYRAMLESSEFGVRYFDHGYAILERGHSGERNDEVLRMVLPQDGLSPASAKPRLSVQPSRKPTSAPTSMASSAKRNAQ